MERKAERLRRSHCTLAHCLAEEWPRTASILGTPAAMSLPPSAQLGPPVPPVLAGPLRRVAA